MGQVLAMNVSKLRSQNTGNCSYRGGRRRHETLQKLAGQLAWYTQQ